MMSVVESFTTDSMTREYHVYKDVWSSFIAEVLYGHHNVCSNHNSPFTAVMMYQRVTSDTTH